MTSSDSPVSLPATEAADPVFESLDSWPVAAQLGALWQSQLAAVAAIGPALPSLALAVEAALPRLQAGGSLVYAGAGSSARLGTQDGAELEPTFDWPAERVVYLIAGGPQALTRAVENAEDDRAAGQDAVRAAGIRSQDVVIGVAASGRTPFTIGCLEEARRLGALTIGVVNSPAAPLLEVTDHPVTVLTGSEPVAGSTRMKAGTAQKVVLNLLSTALMTGLGRVWRGRMVDMRARNEKLRQRAIRMVCVLTGCAEDVASDALGQTDYRIKPAILVVSGLTPARAAACLEEAGGRLREAFTISGVASRSRET
ncbi:N-acetylmuramic acid 6-phosphate etherase [Acetobacter sp. AN02]|uniref:N-acetylmuramic acid 6-phosphate etherase n=1 Tax=Acetobacter sp. AN02 TaxID=2894186 RepID=UPI0024343F0D|nr:N-acetylmuramic acid 6-phosphate etherase [Acetobacter sp. AN02]MDG6094635.1 N-acetylmuramic acid 6-phosphate etherase [Acetobacter sp. AN02]